MKFPFAISRTLILKQPEKAITSESYLINLIEEQLFYLEMEVSREHEYSLVFETPLSDRGIEKKHFLRDLKVTVQTNHSIATITLESTMIPYLFLIIIPIFVFFAVGSITFFIPLIIAGFLIASYFQKYVIISQIRNNLRSYFETESDLTN